MILELIDIVGDLELVTDRNKTVLDYAPKYGNAKAFQAILARAGKLHQEYHNYTICSAVVNGGVQAIEICKLLLQRGASLHHRYLEERFFIGRLVTRQ